MSKTQKEQPSKKGNDVIAKVAIYPGIGIARLGNSPDEFFIGPESPWEDPNPTQKFKDPQGRVKRQAARFRIYAFDGNGNVIKELTVADCEIKWTVEMANKKASYYKFNGRYHQDHTSSNLRNNKDGKDNRSPDERKELIIAPGAKSIDGSSKDKVLLTGGQISSSLVKTTVTVDVQLGELLTDDKGRLLVLGGLGKSDSLIYDNAITDFANNDNWYDDTSDGSISAIVTFPDGSSMIADEAWVLVTPPKFAPNHYNIVSLYDTITEASTPSVDRPTEFYRDIYPILYRTSNYAWISGMAYQGHRAGKGGDFINPVAIQVLSSKEKSINIGGQLFNCDQERTNIANRLRKHIVPEVEWNDDHTKIISTKVPNEEQANKEANYRFMPQLSGDDGDAISFPVPPDYNYNLFKQIPSLTWLSLLPSQQKHVENWAKGEFVVGQPETFIPLENYPLNIQPSMLDRGVLEPCVGGPFFPGIEMTFIADEKATFRGPYRINSKVYKPGDITRIMALPWQADFFECNTHWWPGQRPDDVVSESEYNQAKIQLTNYSYDNTDIANPDEDKNIPDKANTAEVYSSYALAMANRLEWARGIAAPDDIPHGDNIMAKYWHELGFVTKRLAPPVYNNGLPYQETVYVEQERHINAGEISERDFFYMIQNIENFPQILPKVKDYVDSILKNAIDYGHADDTPEQMKFFLYTPEYFEARMMDAYNSFVTDEENYEPATDTTFPDRNSVLTRIKQFAPLNLTDGAWLRHIDKAGPTDEVQSLLFSIYQDERGNGDPSLNHCNIYKDLCHSIGYYPAPVDSREFANDPTLLDSAFTTPTFELAISQFTDSYYPEILGMTLFLEWSVIELKPTIKLLDYYGLNPHFYVMHVGIDNAVNGHGRRAIDAVNLYLDNIRQMGGEDAVQQQFKRIWSGYIAFSFAGTFGQDLSNLISQPVSLSQQMQNMIVSKAKFGRLNHDQHTLGANKINDWFEDPDGFMQALVDAGYIVPGNIQGSKFFSLLEFQNGPMFRVFTDAEIQLWKDWTIWLANKTPDITPVVSSFEAMKMLILTLNLQQAENPEHASISIKEADTNISHSISWWFTQEPVKFMEALCSEKNKLIVKYEPDNSTFITRFISSANKMGQAFNYVIPNTGGMTGRQIVIRWISDGCPLDSTEPVLPKEHILKYSQERLWLTSSSTKKSALKSKKIVGMGSVH